MTNEWQDGNGMTEWVRNENRFNSWKMNPVLSPIGGSTGFIFREIKTEWQMNDRIGKEWQNVSGMRIDLTLR